MRESETELMKRASWWLLLAGEEREGKKKRRRKQSGGFRDKKIIEYENRIRLYSNPEKIFRYFASIKIVYNNGDSEIYMTPDDFLRALTPGVKQPDGLGLDQFKKIDLSKGKNDFKHDLKPDSIFYKLSKFGLINFSDFLFLLTVISVSRRHFEIAFRFFDENGDGDLEFEEFEKVQNAILSQTSIGQKMGKSVHYKGVSSAVSRYFFGADLKQRLTIDNFIDFQRSLQSELLNLEFERKHPDESGRISETDFAELLVAYANLSEKKRERMIRRVMKKFGGDNTLGITMPEYQNFFRFLQNINDVDIALTVYNIAGASIDQATLKHVGKTVANVELSDHLVEVVFTLFDDNEDNQLSNKEFISVMKERLRRGLSKPKDTGFLKIMATIWKSLTSLDF
ncbi:PREDICTED: calcium uptake protein 1 homolog, mitochondrial-like [Rhagoletis zephyria]|uniref:calcium uptake protein 1 homolog, mitochondrial-like n=1 Tax=Rhagoletis zephyria TaxID=28612 RepID=UPI000811A760|nr:PREDICTED: calcium uptake protein 1 homolog, mitochondrial-like [Rhagoletis zephyria]